MHIGMECTPEQGFAITGGSHSQDLKLRTRALHAPAQRAQSLARDVERLPLVRCVKRLDNVFRLIDKGELRGGRARIDAQVRAHHLAASRLQDGYLRQRMTALEVNALSFGGEKGLARYRLRRERGGRLRKRAP